VDIPEQHRYLGVDVGGTKVAFRAESRDGRVEEISFEWGPRHSFERDLAQLADGARAMTARTGTPFQAVGVAMPATVGSDEVVTAWPSRPEWTGRALGPALRGLFPGATVAWADDGDLGALAEAEESDCDDLLYLGVGTGVGGGLVLGGQLCPGPARGSFEIGHVVVDLAGPECVCGRRGCVQAIASGPATLRHAAQLRSAAVRFHDLRDGLCERVAWATAALDRTCHALAVAIASVAELVHPRLALIGGGFAAGVPEFVDRVAAHLDALARPGQFRLPVAPARLSGRSSLIGAALLARQQRPDQRDATGTPAPIRPRRSSTSSAAPVEPAAAPNTW